MVPRESLTCFTSTCWLHDNSALNFVSFLFSSTCVHPATRTPTWPLPERASNELTWATCPSQRPSLTHSGHYMCSCVHLSILSFEMFVHCVPAFATPQQCHALHHCFLPFVPFNSYSSRYSHTHLTPPERTSIEATWATRRSLGDQSVTD